MSDGVSGSGGMEGDRERCGQRKKKQQYEFFIVIEYVFFFLPSSPSTRIQQDPMKAK